MTTATTTATTTTVAAVVAPRGVLRVKCGYTYNPYSWTHTQRATLAAETSLEAANYAYATGAGVLMGGYNVAMQDALGSFTVPYVPLLHLVPDQPTPSDVPIAELFCGGLPYQFSARRFAQVLRDATRMAFGHAARIYRCEEIPDRKGPFPTSCRVEIHADDVELCVSLHKQCIITGAGLVVIPCEDVFAKALEERNGVLAAAREHHGLKERAGLRPLVIQRATRAANAAVPPRAVTTAPHAVTTAPHAVTSAPHAVTTAPHALV